MYLNNVMDIALLCKALIIDGLGAICLAWWAHSKLM